MAKLKKKTYKRISKRMRKLVKKHGSDVITTIVATAISAVETKPKAGSPARLKVHKASKKRKSTMASHTPA